ncbi:hypothetical protein GCM10010393_45210 [Streptomyces gobitricini]|uniref:Transposase n=1 Tax=Streptomyces gobitricini TaxID=68211 RepID=A0ABN3MRN6_9ACTN
MRQDWEPEDLIEVWTLLEEPAGQDRVPGGVHALHLLRSALVHVNALLISRSSPIRSGPTPYRG